MGCGKTVRFLTEDGQWRSGKHYSPSKKGEHEHEHEHSDAEKEVQNNSVWSKPEYDTEKFASYIDYLMGNEKKPVKKDELFNNKITVGWGKLQGGFASKAHKLTAEQLSDSLNNETATERINNLDKKSLSEIERLYKLTNRMVLSDTDNAEQRVINAFLKGEGLKPLIIDGKEYNALIFDENSEQSKNLEKSDVFVTYYNNYISKLSEIISDTNNGEVVDINAISDKLKTELGKPNFSDPTTIFDDDYYGLMGGVQKVDIDFEIIPLSDNRYKIQTKMYLTDWYGADSDDIGSEINLENSVSNAKFISSRIIDNTNPLSSTPKGANEALIAIGIENVIPSLKKDFSSFKSHFPGLKELFILQHKYGRKPFATQIIYQTSDEITIDKK